jgi:CheY-like chemotaxis protein
MKTILFIDDDQFVTTLYRTKLLSEGFQVETANSGAEAMSKLETLRPDTIVLDLNMPEMNGVDVLRQIRSNPELKEVPVIIFSNAHVQKLVDEVSPLGVQKFFSKSQCPPNRLLTEVKNTLDSLAASAAANTPPPTALETASASIQAGGPEIPQVGAHPEVQRKTLARLFRKTQPVLKEALSGEAGSRRELLGRAVKGLFDNLYDHPEQISPTSVQTLMKGIENLSKADPASAQPAQDAETALQGMLNAFDS